MRLTYCIFSAQYLPNIGGVENYTYNLAKGLVEQGNEVIVISNNVHNVLSKEEHDGIKVYRLPCINLLNGRFPILKINKEFFKLAKQLSHIKPDKVIINTRFYIHSVYGVLWARRRDIQPVVIEHGTNHLSVNNKILDKIGGGFEHIITMFIKLYCKEFYGVSEACNEWLKHFNITAKSVIYNAIDIKKINDLLNSTQVDYRKKYNIKNDDIVITFTGRLIKEKGILNLVEAMKQLNNKKIHLFIAGDGPLLEEINMLSTANINVLGKLTFPQVIDLLKESDIFCLPSESEGFPTSVLEAVACQCFIITTERGGAKELIINKEYGIIMDNNSVANIYTNLSEVVEDKLYRASAVQNSYIKLIEKFTWEKVIEKVKTI